MEDERKIEEVDFCKGKLLARCKRFAEGGKAGRRERRMCFYVAMRRCEDAADYILFVLNFGSAYF